MWKTESWECQSGMTDVRVDDNGCPVDREFCKVQAGGIDAAVLTTAAWSITITLDNFLEARVKGLVLQAFSNAAGNADVLHTQTVTSINIMGTENLGNGSVGAERFRADAQGGYGAGTGQAYRGVLGTQGGPLVITGVNNSLVTVTVIATVDVNARRGD